MKQTAVEYLEGIIYGDKEFSLSEVFEQAKEMEKEQIMKAVYDSMGTNLDPNMGRAELYYNETYKNTKE
jgi:hypothetical protein